MGKSALLFASPTLLSITLYMKYISIVLGGSLPDCVISPCQPFSNSTRQSTVVTRVSRKYSNNLETSLSLSLSSTSIFIDSIIDMALCVCPALFTKDALAVKPWSLGYNYLLIYRRAECLVSALICHNYLFTQFIASLVRPAASNVWPLSIRRQRRHLMNFAYL